MRRSRDQAGYVLVVFAGLLVVLIGFVALAVDTGVLYSARTSAQRAADAAALAGAFTYVVNPYGTTADRAARAQQHAQQSAVQNNILGTNITLAEVAATADVDNRRVTVDITHNVETFFAKAVGWQVATVGVRAIAEASASARGEPCPRPWFLPNSILSPAATAARNWCAACTANPQELLVDSSGTPTSWALQRIQLEQPVIVKPGNPQSALDPGDFFCIDVDPSCAGGDCYREAISRCADELASCGNVFTVLTGNRQGPTGQGVRDLLGPNPDTFVHIGQYRRADGTMSDTSPQLIDVPVWDVCENTNPNNCNTVGTYCQDSRIGRNPMPPCQYLVNLPGHGTNVTIRVVGFATIFVDGMAGNDVRVHIVDAKGCSGGGGGIDPTESGPFALPVRLIRLP